MPPPAEPTLAAYPNPFLRYFAATRPPFLSVTFAACLVGLATAALDGAMLRPLAAFFTVFFALVAHAGINVLNDYYDALNGSDAANSERQFPFTGGSRFIQNGVLTPRQVLGFAGGLFGATIIGGLWLLSVAGVPLFWIGLVGLLIGWAYSAPPLQLNSRGLGELCVAAGFLLIVAGADTVQRGALAPLPWLAGMPYALLVTNILYINQFPDRAADRASGKLHWVARLDPGTAAWGYGLILLLAAGVLVSGILLDVLPLAAAGVLVAWIPAVQAWRQLRRFAATPERLAPAIRLTLIAAHAQPLLLGAILLLTGEPS